MRKFVLPLLSIGCSAIYQGSSTCPSHISLSEKEKLQVRWPEGSSGKVRL